MSRTRCWGTATEVRLGPGEFLMPSLCFGLYPIGVVENTNSLPATEHRSFRAAALVVPLVAAFCEACQDPAIRSDVAVSFWPRVCMFAVGLICVEAYRQHLGKKPAHLVKWAVVYAVSFFVTAEALHRVTRI